MQQRDGSRELFVKLLPTTLIGMLGLVGAVGSTAWAQSYQFTVGATGSPAVPSFAAQLSAGTELAGTLIGNYSQATNPTGTRTLNFNFFGTRPPAPTNIAKNITGTVTGSSSPATRPSGAYRLTVDTTALTVRMEGLQIDLLNGGNTDFALTAQLTYQSFLTASPNYGYPFLFPIPVPLGSARLTALTLSQPVGIQGALTGGTTPGTYTFALEVPAILAGEFVFGLSTSPIPPIPQVLQVTGTVTPGPESATARLSMPVSQTQSFTDPVPLPPDQPVDLPPPTGTGDPAQVLITATLTGASVTVNGSLSLPAAGPRAFCPSDLDDGSGTGTRDGGVTLDDLIYFLDQFEAGRLPADLDNGSGTGTRDGGVDINDLLFFLERFRAGC